MKPFLKTMILGSMVISLLGCGSSAPKSISDVSVIKYWVFCKKLQANLEHLDQKAEMNGFCVFKSFDQKEVLDQFSKENGFPNFQKFQKHRDPILKLFGILLLEEWAQAKNKQLSHKSVVWSAVSKEIQDLIVSQQKQKVLDQLAVLKKEYQAQEIQAVQKYWQNLNNLPEEYRVVRLQKDS